MALQTPNLVMVGLGNLNDTPPNSIQPSLVDGIHLRWAFKPEFGFPWYGFYLFRRPHQESTPRCLSKMIRNMTAELRLSAELDIRTFGRMSSDNNLALTDDFPPGGLVEFDLDGRRYIRIALSPENFARRVEVQIGFRQGAKIQVTSLSENMVVAQVTVSGRAGQVKSALVESDTISAIQLSGGPAALVDLCFVPVSENATVGWEPVSDFPYPMCLPLTHPDYPCSGGRSENLAAAAALARDRIRYGDPDRLAGPPVALPSAGTVSVITGSPIVLGAGTNWTEELVGAVLQVIGGRTGYTVATVISPSKLVLSRPYTDALGTGRAYALHQDSFGQLHDYLAHLVAGGSAAGPMSSRHLPLPIAVSGTVTLNVGSLEVRGIGTSWGPELIGLALQVVGDNRGTVAVTNGSHEVRGISTSWGPGLTGLAFHVAGERTAYTIIGVEPLTQQLWLDRGYAESGGVGRAYQIVEKTAYTVSQVASPTHLKLDRDYHGHDRDRTTYTRAYVIRGRLQPTESGGAAPLMPRQYPLDLILLAALDPAVAQMLGLYWVDQRVNLGLAYDYLILADYNGRFSGDAAEALRQLGARSFADVDGYIVFNRRAEPAEPLAPPADVRVYALPGTTISDRGRDGRPSEARQVAGLRWGLDTGDLGVLPERAVMYHVWRARLGNGETPAAPTRHEPITSGRPALIVEPEAALGRMPERPPDWPPFPLHGIDRGLSEGWYSYQISAIDIFGRHSPNSAAAAWHQWTPAPEPRPWYYDDSRGDSTVNPIAVMLLDKIGPPPPTGIEAYALDPADPLVFQDEAYNIWRERNPGVVGLRVRWLWTQAHTEEAPDTTEFRIYYQPGQMNAWLGNTRRVSMISPSESIVETDIANTRPANIYVGTQLRIGADSFKVLGSEAGSQLRLRVRHVGPFYRGGTIELTNNSAVITGSGTNWGPELADLMLRQEGEEATYNILRVDSPTQLVLERVYTGAGGAGRGYVIIGGQPRVHAPCTLALPAPHTVGTVMVFKGSPVVIGTNTNWGAELVQSLLKVGGGQTEYRIARVDSPTQLVLERGYEGGNGRERGYSIRHSLFVDYSAPAAWQQRIHVVGYDEHVTEVMDRAVTGGGPPVRRYEVFLSAPDIAEGQPLGPSLANPLVYAHVSVSAAVNKTHTPDDPRWAAGRWGGRPGNEGRVGPQATIFRVRRERPRAPVPPPDSERVFATPADYHGRSFYTYRWRPQANLKTHIFRALDDSVFKRDWLVRTTRTSLNLDIRQHDELFPKDPPPAPPAQPNTPWSIERKRAAALELNTISSREDYRRLSLDARRVLARLPGNQGVMPGNALEERDWAIRRSRSNLTAGDTQYFPSEWSEPDNEQNRLRRQNAALGLNRIASYEAYRTLSNDTLRVLSGLPGNEAAFAQVTIQPLDPDDPANANRVGPNNPPDFPVDPGLRIYIDALDGRSTNRYLYRGAYLDGAHNRSELGLASAPVYMLNVVPPRSPSTSRVTGGDRRVSIYWIANKEPNLAFYRVYRSATSESSADVRRMAEVALVAVSPSAPPEAGVILPGAVAGKPMWLQYTDPAPPGTWFYRIVAEDVDGNRSRPSDLLCGTAVLAPLVAPVWDPPVRRATVVSLSWRHPDPQLSCLVERRAPADSLWLTVSGWLLRGVYSYDDQPPDLTAAWEYRLRVRDIKGQVANILPTVGLDAEI